MNSSSDVQRVDTVLQKNKTKLSANTKKRGRSNAKYFSKKSSNLSDGNTELVFPFQSRTSFLMLANF